MRLLIPHSTPLENQKRLYGFKIFGDINKELCIDTVHLSYEATQLCLAFQIIRSRTQEESEVTYRIIATAGRYTILLENQQLFSRKEREALQVPTPSLHPYRYSYVDYFYSAAFQVSAWN